MHVRTLAPIIALTASAVLVLSGCSDDSVEGTAKSVADPSSSHQTSAADSSATPGKDSKATPGKLDPGKFRTTPQPAFTTIGDAGLGRSVEGQRMAEFVTLPGEIDPEVTQLSPTTTNVLRDADGLADLLTQTAADTAKADGMLVGFSTGRYKNNSAGSVSRSFDHAVLRFADPAGAVKAARDLNAATTDFKPTAIDVLPLSQVSIMEDAKGRATTHSFTPHGDYVLYDSVTTAASDRAAQPKIIATSVSKQGPLIDKFPKTPADQLANVRVDIDGVLIYTIPKNMDDRKTNDYSVYGPRGSAHFSHDPDVKKMELYGKTGTTRIATDGTRVYKSQTEKGAKTLVAALHNEMTTEMKTGHSKFTEVGPPGVPNAACVTQLSSGGAEAQTACLVQKGIYVGQSSAADQKTAQQQITAQYMILAEATK